MEAVFLYVLNFFFILLLSNIENYHNHSLRANKININMLDFINVHRMLHTQNSNTVRI